MTDVLFVVKTLDEAEVFKKRFKSVGGKQVFGVYSADVLVIGDKLTQDDAKAFIASSNPKAVFCVLPAQLQHVVQAESPQVESSPASRPLLLVSIFVSQSEKPDNKRLPGTTLRNMLDTPMIYDQKRSLRDGEKVSVAYAGIYSVADGVEFSCSGDFGRISTPIVEYFPVGCEWIVVGSNAKDSCVGAEECAALLGHILQFHCLVGLGCKQIK